MEQLEEKKLPQGTVKELKGEIDAIHAERKEQKRLRTRKKIAKRKQVKKGHAGRGLARRGGQCGKLFLFFSSP